METAIATPTVPHPGPLAALDIEALRGLVRRHGYDATIRMLYDAICATPRHAAFIKTVHSAPPLAPVTLVVVPGALYNEYPQTGADGKRFITLVRNMGLTAHVIPTRSLGSLARNAQIITHWLAAHPPAAGEKRMLISFSKGSADIKTALRDPRKQDAFRQVTAWLSVGGILHGTPLVAWLNARPLRHFFVRCLLRLKGIDPRPLQELAHSAGTPLAAPTVVPPWLTLIHLVTLPTAGELSMPLARRAFQRLLPVGPNDAGGLLLGDLSRFPGFIYPLLGTDHYLRNCVELPSVLQKIIASACGIPPTE